MCRRGVTKGVTEGVTKGYYPTVGERVEILNAQKQVWHLRHRKTPVYGYVTHIDGEYIDVRPTWCSWVVELYPCEIAQVGDVYDDV